MKNKYDIIHMDISCPYCKSINKIPLKTNDLDDCYLEYNVGDLLTGFKYEDNIVYCKGKSICCNSDFNIMVFLKVSNNPLLLEISEYYKIIPKEYDYLFCGIIQKQTNCTIRFTNNPIKNSIPIKTDNLTLYYQFNNMNINLNSNNEKLQKELDRKVKMINIINEQLLNIDFISKAKPEVIELQKKKKNDIEKQIRELKEIINEKEN